MKQILFVFAALLLCASVQGTTSFSFYVFASEWAGTVCETQNCSQDQGVDTQFWNVHGLWPSDGSQGVNYCTDEKFDPSKLSSIKGELEQYWSGLYSSADSFHSHEWTKHGTCSNMSQLDYFAAVIQLAKAMDIYGTLKDNGITPGGTYACSDIADVIKKAYGVTAFTLQATSGKLTGLELCISKTLQAKNCGTTSICKGNVSYPKFTA